MTVAWTMASSVGQVVRVRVPGKINLALGVGARRADGYHELATLFQAVSLYDEVTAAATDDGSVTCSVTGEGASLIGPGLDNLAVRAARFLIDSFDVGRQGAHIEIVKRIPVAGGMAGGSADAAAALLACSTVWRLDLRPEELLAVGSELGSDVPFALMGGCAIGTGRGENLTPALSRGTYHWVLAFAETGLSTREAFGVYDDLCPDPPDPVVPIALMSALIAGDPVRLGAALVNDLEPVACALRPALRQTLETGRGLGALGAIVSGSGPTVAFLLADDQAADDFATRLSQRDVARAVLHVVGPVGGAAVLP